jgi:hypothetical protein
MLLHGENIIYNLTHFGVLMLIHIHNYYLNIG